MQPLEERGYEVFGEVACRVTDFPLPNTDAAVILRERLEAANPDEFIREAPALAIEVHSPGKRQLRRKADLYLEHGAEQVWIVYPKTRRVLVLTPGGEDNQVREGETLEFHGVTGPVSEIFPAA